MRLGIFTGNLGRDWEMKSVGSYTVYENTLAVKSGKDNKETIWVKLSQWNEKGGEILTQYTGKGSKLLVTGDIDVSAYLDKQGAAKADLRVRVNSFEFIGEKKPEQPKPEDTQADDIPF
jgi:single-strand DNA-binding protein